MQVQRDEEQVLDGVIARSLNAAKLGASHDRHPPQLAEVARQDLGGARGVLGADASGQRTRGQCVILRQLDALEDDRGRRHTSYVCRGCAPARGRPKTGGDPALTAGQVVERWETLKQREREAAGQPANKPRTTLSGVPKTLPSLLRAYEVSARAAAVGFDWARASDVLEKIDEEVAELRHEVESGATGDLSRAEEEMGDLLFAIANLSRKLGIEPEAALRRANDKFTSRFDAVERAFTARGRPLSEATLEEMDAEWRRVKSSS